MMQQVIAVAVLALKNHSRAWGRTEALKQGASPFVGTANAAIGSDSTSLSSDFRCKLHSITLAIVVLPVQVLPALAYAHQQGVAHGDLQLSRLLLHSSGSIKLCGFGSAARLAEDSQPSKDIW
jgi:hypothetical protein